jgi:hypothetical protein
LTWEEGPTIANGHRHDHSGAPCRARRERRIMAE